MGKFYITTPIYYVNAVPHVGTAYTTVLADAIARYQRLRGRQVLFLTGTDEHGQKLEREAKKHDKTPAMFVQEMSEQFIDAWRALNIQYDVFLQTTDHRHIALVQEWWKLCARSGDIYLGAHKGAYCVACEEHKTNKDLLPGGLCPIHKRPVEQLEEPSYFFRLSRYTAILEELYRTQPERLEPEERRNEVLSFLKDGLRDLSISRTAFRWGIPVPNDPAHIMYVWFDALLNYFTGPNIHGANSFWPPTLQLCGKDILRFHAIYYPAFLLSAGVPKTALPKTIWSHGWLLSAEGHKISKSGTTHATTRDVRRITQAVGCDALRYYLLRNTPLGADGTFELDELLLKVDVELAKTIGNLLHRTGPFATCPLVDSTAAAATETRLADYVEAHLRRALQAWDSHQTAQALEHTLEIARAGNRYWDEQRPWTLPNPSEGLGIVLSAIAELLRIVSVLLWPAVPQSADKLRHQLGYPSLCPTPGEDLWPTTFRQGGPRPTLEPGAPIFPRIDRNTRTQILTQLKDKP